jgi:hypothetical protein
MWLILQCLSSLLFWRVAAFQLGVYLEPKLGHYLVGSDHDNRSAFRSAIQLASDDHSMAGFWIIIPSAIYYYQASHLWQIFIFVIDLANHMHFWYDWPPSIMQVGLVNSANLTLLCYTCCCWQLIVNSSLVNGSDTIFDKIWGPGQTWTKTISVLIIALTHKQYRFISTFVGPSIRIGHIE